MRHARTVAAGPGRTLLSLALLAACAPLRAEGSGTEGSIRVGIGAFSGDPADRALSNQYGGLRTDHVIGLLGVDVERRDAEQGTSMSLTGRHLPSENRELDFRWKKQGDWRFGANYGEGVWRDPNVPRTGLVGAGTTTPQVVALTAGAGAGTDDELKIKRTRFGLSFSKLVSPALQVDIGLSTEDKTGTRLFGAGFTCGSAVAPGCRPGTGTETGSALLLLPEPIKANHTQIEARVSYAIGGLRLSIGYDGSLYRNAYDTLRPVVPGSLVNPVGQLLPLSTGLQSILGQPIALPPDNQAHQWDLSGSYAFGGSTRANFKLAHASATQDQDFAAAGLGGAPAGVANLGGRIDTTLAQVGISARPLPKLSLLARLRYDDRVDKTPLAPYNVEGTDTYTNRHLPRTRSSGTLQASYQLPHDLRATLGVDGEHIDRGVFTASSAVAGISALRQKTDETGWRAELRGTFGETVSGAIGLYGSRRSGSNWLRNNSGLGVTEVTDPGAAGSGLESAIFMPTLADRRRQKVRLSADWQPSERLSLQLRAEDGTDRYPTSLSTQGLRSTGMNLLDVDWRFALTERWNLNGYLSRAKSRLHQARPGGYILAFDNTATQVGLDVTGKPANRIEWGGGLTYTDDRSVYRQTLDGSAAAGSADLLAATGGLPDIVFRQLALHLFAGYALDKRSQVRVEIAHQHVDWNDWAWAYAGVPFTYADGSTVQQRPRQAVSALAVSYVYRWD